jgi:hypothetical protein
MRYEEKRTEIKAFHLFSWRKGKRCNHYAPYSYMQTKPDFQNNALKETIE